MKSIRKSLFLKVLVLAIAAIVAPAIPAHAQAASGTFTLAHKVRWGGASLPAGNYAFSLDSQNLPAHLTVRQLDGSAAIMLVPTMISEKALTGASSLVLRDQSGESFVSTLQLASLGLALEFASPKLTTPAAQTAGLAPPADPRAAK